MRPVSEATSRIAGQSFSKKYIALGRIVSYWDDIVGQELASKAQPARLRYHKHRNARKSGRSPDVVLEIATSSAYATQLHYQADLILERINRIFGERWITSLRFVNIPANSKQARIKRPPPPLSSDEQQVLGETLRVIEDEEIKLRLEKLGEAVIREDKS